MAKNNDSSKTNITRIKATSTSKVKTEKAIKKSAPTKVRAKRVKKEGEKAFILFRPFVALGAYFKGSWFELRQVHWPTRRATWGLTGAVILFTMFFVVFILLLDAFFKFIFEIILR